MVLVQLNLDQELNQVHVELLCPKLNSDPLIPFSWMATVIPWTTLIGQSTLGLRAYYSDVIITHIAYETVRYRLAKICSNFKFPEVITQFLHQQLYNKVLKIRILCCNSYLLFYICCQGYVYHKYGIATTHQHLSLIHISEPTRPY